MKLVTINTHSLIEENYQKKFKIDEKFYDQIVSDLAQRNAEVAEAVCENAQSTEESAVACIDATEGEDDK